MHRRKLPLLTLRPLCSGPYLLLVVLGVRGSRTLSFSSLASRYGRPLLMTEIGVSDASTSAAQQQALIDELVPFLDGLDSVSHYAWFMAAPGFLVNADGSLTALGEAYNNA